MVAASVRLVAAAGVVGVLFFVACTGSEELDLRRDAGSPSGAAGAAAGNSGGGAGTSGVAGAKGQAGATGAAGTQNGAAGVSGAGAGNGASGTTGAGSGAAGTTGAGTGTAGAGGSKVDGGAGAGGAGSSGATDAGTAPIKYAGYMENFFILNCGGCHVAVNGKTTGNFAFSYENFLAPVNPEHAGCPNLDASKRRVVPGKPENSLVYIKASLPTPPSACGGHMPNSNSMLGDSSLKLIYDWIKQGANP